MHTNASLRSKAAKRRYIEWMWRYEFAKLAAHFAKLEALVETRGVTDVAIHEPHANLAKLLPSPAALKEGLTKLLKHDTATTTHRHTDTHTLTVPKRSASLSLSLLRTLRSRVLMCVIFLGGGWEQ